MKRLGYFLAMVLLFIAPGQAQIPRTISYQGVLCEPSGEPKPDAEYSLTFRLYSAPSEGTLLWSEQKSLATRRGLFATQLGDKVPLASAATFDAPLWLSIQLRDEAEMSPRIPLGSVGNSFRSIQADTAAYAGRTGRAARADTADYALTAAGGESSPWKTAGNDIYYDKGWVGIGTSAPSARLHVAGGLCTTGGAVMGRGASREEGGFLAIGDSAEAYNFGAFALGAKTKAGGLNSFALGLETLAGGEWSTTAMGWQSTASGDVATAMGAKTKASGDYSTAMGHGSEAHGNSSTAMGGATTARGNGSTAMGSETFAEGDYATAMGKRSVASGSFATAMGFRTVANGDYSTAMGSLVSTERHPGSFIIGDCSAKNLWSTPPETVSCARDNEFTAVFAGGYTLYTTRDLSQGVYMNGGTSGWTNISDRNKKENFRAIDGEELLAKVRSLSVSEWNYKNSDPSVRYIGPMAQDFYSAFRLGGTDSLGINSICIDGVNMAAVQALERRTTQLREKTAELAELRVKLARLEERLSQLESDVRKFRDLAGR